MTQICVCGLINHPNNPDLYLAVSRKNNPNDFGLFGGKYEKEDIRYDWGLEREIIEETGLKTILNTNELFTDIENNNIVLTYKGIIHYKQHPDEIKTEETGEVKWLLASQLITGSFADYNKKCLIFLELNMTNPIPKLRYLINLLLTPGMDFKATNLEYDTHKFISKEDIETYLGEKFIEANHSKIIKQFDNGNVIVIFHWINNERTGITLKISDTLKMTVSTIHYLLQMEEDLILYKDKT